VLLFATVVNKRELSRVILKEVQTLVCATGGKVTWTPLLVAFPQQGALDFTRLIWTVWQSKKRKNNFGELSRIGWKGQPRSYGKTLNFENRPLQFCSLARYFTDFQFANFTSH
jgi:hypothetical protein